jgi:hypothetical protein
MAIAARLCWAALLLVPAVPAILSKSLSSRGGARVRQQRARRAPHRALLPVVTALRRAQGARLVPPVPRLRGPRGPHRRALLRRADDLRPLLRLRPGLPLPGPGTPKLLVHGPVPVAAGAGRLPRWRDPVRRALRLPVRGGAAGPSVQGRRRLLRPPQGAGGSGEPAQRRQAGHHRGPQLRRHAVAPVPAAAAPGVAQALRAGGRAVGRRRPGHAHARLGNSLGLPFVDPLALRDEYRSLQSSLWPLPSPGVFGAARPLVTTRSRAYTAHDMAAFLEDIGMGAAVGPYESRVLPLFRGWTRRRCWRTRETASTRRRGWSWGTATGW